MSYLKDRILPGDKEEARKLRVRAAKFILRDVYEEVYGNHS